MADKDFKVKNKLFVNGLSHNSGVILATNNNLDSHTTVPTQYGGTGTTTSPNAGQIPYSSSGTNYAPTDLSSLTISSSGGSTITAASASTKGLIIKGASSQTANLQEWQNSAGTALTTIDNNAGFYAQYIEAKNTAGVLVSGESQIKIASPDGLKDIRFWNRNDAGGLYYYNSSGGSKNILRIAHSTDPRIVTQTWQDFTSGSSANYGGRVNIDTSITTAIGMVIRGVASQTADLQQWQNSAGTTLSKIDASGNITALSYNLSDSKYLLRKTIKKTVDPAGNAVANNTYDLFDMNFPLSLQGTFYIQASIRGPGYGQNLTYSLPVTYQMDWISNYAITNPFTNSTTWVDLTPLTFSPRHLMTNDYFKFQAKVNNNQISFRIKLTGTLTNTPLFDIYIQHSEEFANCTITELNTTGTDATTSNVMPNFLSSRAGLSAIFNPISLYSNSAYNIPLTVKGFASQSANLQEWQNSSGTALAKIDATGALNLNVAASSTLTTPIVLENSATGTGTGTQIVFRYGGGNYASISSVYSGSPAGPNMVFNVGSTGAKRMQIDNNGTIAINGFAASAQGLIVKGASSQNANLQEWQNSAGTVLASIASTGQINAGAGFYTDWAGVGTGRIGAAHLSVSSQYLGNIVSIFKGTSGQTANLTEWQNSAGTVLASISAAGNLTVQDLTVNGTTTTINSTTLTVDDKNIELASVASPTDTTADGAGITIKGATDKTFNWVQSTGAFTSSEPISTPALSVSGNSVSSNITLAAGKRYFVDTTSARTLTLPASPSLGDEIKIFDASGTAATNNITIARNGNKINGQTEDAIIDVNQASSVFVYTGATVGWRFD